MALQTHTRADQTIEMQIGLGCTTDEATPPHCLALSAQRQGIHCRPALPNVQQPVASFLVKHASLGGAHKSPQLPLPANVHLVFLPPYGPELNSLEQVWRDLKDALTWLQFPTLEAQRECIATLFQGV